MGNQGITAVAGSDILSINGVVISGHADGDAYKLEPQGPISQYKVSKDGNSIVALQYTGILCKLTVRLIRDCADDQTLNGLLQQWISAPNTFSLMDAEYIKSTGDGKGNVTNEVYVLSGGTFEMIPGGHTSMDGTTEQSVTVYTLWFRNDARLMT
jgi:hypothetical protein